MLVFSFDDDDNETETINKNSEDNTIIFPIEKEEEEIEIVSIEATKEYYCPLGYELNGTSCKNEVETDALIYYVCDEGMPLVTGECSTYVKEYVEPIWYCMSTHPLWPEDIISKQCSEDGYPRNIAGCPLGYYLDGDDACSKMVEKRTPAKIEYICPSDYIVDNDKCKRTNYIEASYNLKCPSDYKLVGTKCIKNKE